MKTFITGAAGFIGSQCAHRIYRDGKEIIMLDNFSFGSEDNLIFEDADFRKDIVRGDIRDRELITSIFRDNEIDYVYHFAGIAPLPENQINPANAIHVNIEGFINVLEAGRLNGVKKTILASTAAIYENDQVFPSKETDFELPCLIYANTKYAAERFAQSYCDTYGMDIVCLRFSNVYGPHIDCLRKQPPFVGYAIRELFYNRVPVFHSNGQQKRDYVYVDDLLNLAMLVQIGSGFDIVNVAANENYSVDELYHIMARIMNKDIEPHYTDESHYWKKYPELYEGKYPIRNEVLIKEVNKYTLCDNLHAMQKYGWTIKTGIEEGLSKTIHFAIKELEKHNAK